MMEIERDNLNAKLARAEQHLALGPAAPESAAPLENRHQHRRDRRLAQLPLSSLRIEIVAAEGEFRAVLAELPARQLRADPPVAQGRRVPLRRGPRAALRGRRVATGDRRLRSTPDARCSSGTPGRRDSSR